MPLYGVMFTVAGVCLLLTVISMIYAMWSISSSSVSNTSLTKRMIPYMIAGSLTAITFVAGVILWVTVLVKG